MNRQQVVQVIRLLCQLFQFFLLLEPEVAELGFVSLLVLAVLLEELALLDLRHEFELDQLGAKLLDFE